MVKNFSSVFIKNLKYTGCQVYHLDKVKFSSPGQLGIRIGKSTRSWFVQSRVGGKLRKQNIAVYPAVGLAEARILASVKLEEMKSNPVPIVRSAKHTPTDPTVADLWEAYQEVLDLRKKKKAAGTLYVEQNRWRNEIKPVIGHLPVKDVPLVSSCPF